MDGAVVDKPVTQLSVGQQQRVAAARALIGEPELIIADEPTSSLDADRRENFIQLLFNECRQRSTTLIFVSHDKAFEGLFHRTPILLLWGEKDFVFRPKVLSLFQEIWPHAEVHRFEDAGHWLLEDAPDEVAERVRRFLAATGATAP